MDCLSEQARDIRAVRAVRKASTFPNAWRHRSGATALSPTRWVPPEYEKVRQKLVQMPEPPLRPRLGKSEWLGGLGVFPLMPPRFQ